MRHHKRHFGLLAAAVLALGCGAVSDDITVDPPGGIYCTYEARAGITLDVHDSATNALVGRNSKIIAREGAVADTSRFTAVSDGPYPLVYERAGTYTVTVEQAGYKLWTQAGVLVTKNGCHVNGVAVTARLQP